MLAIIKQLLFSYLLGIFFIHPPLLAQEFTLDYLNNLIIELPAEMKQVVARINPKIVFIYKSKEFFGSYNNKKNVLSLNHSIKNNSEALKRTVFHELAHLYDIHATKVVDRKKLETECFNEESSNNDFCHMVNQKYLKLSSDIIFQTLFGARIDSRRTIYLENLILERSPDHYEFKNERELFAVNFEYFMLDKEYKCRRPLQYKYFSNIFSGFEAFRNVECNSTYPFVKTDQANAELIDIDINRVYRIDYLQAAPAKDDIAGGFGHSMLRIVICAPERKTVNSECLKDKDSHLVVSFRASVDDEQISSLKGLKGSYPSNLYIMELQSVIEEYTQIQYRDLVTYPLNLTKNQIQKLIAQMSLQHWSLERRYYFASNNCASEIVNLIRSSLGTEVMFLTTPIKPLDMPAWFYETNLISSNIDTEIFKSAEYYWQKTLDLLIVGNKIKLKNFMKLNSQKRNEIYSNAIKTKPGAKTNALIRLLEFKVYSYYKQLYYAELLKVLKDLIHFDTSKLTEILGIRNAGWILVDKSNNSKSYGIPDSEELKNVEYFLKKRDMALRDQINSLKNIVNENSEIQTEALEDLKRKQEESKSILESFQTKK